MDSAIASACLADSERSFRSVGTDGNAVRGLRSAHSVLRHGDPQTMRPHGVEGFLRRVNGLLLETQAPNWGCEGESPITHQDWLWAIYFAVRLHVHGLPLPLPAPCGDGSVHLTWFASGGRRFVLQHKGARTLYSSRSADGVYASGDAEDDSRALSRLREFLA
jgi:hypothetical protein